MESGIEVTGLLGPFMAVGIIGAAVGVAGLVARFRAEPVLALRTVPGVFYICINAGASIFALALIHAFNWTFGVDSSNEIGIWWTQILVAGFGAVALFRTSLFSVRVGEEEVAIGPNWFLQVMLGAVDREVDRSRAKPRAIAVANIMRQVSFKKAQLALPAFCFGLMQNVTKEEQKQIADQTVSLDLTNIDENVKALLLGLSLMNVVGKDVLQAAVNSISESIKE